MVFESTLVVCIEVRVQWHQFRPVANELPNLFPIDLAMALRTTAQPRCWPTGRLAAQRLAARNGRILAWPPRSYV